MAGAYCKFCQTRCFVPRLIPDGPCKGWSGHMATCVNGMAHDLKVTGHTHLSAINPVLEPEAAEAVHAWWAGRQGRKAIELAAGEGTAELTSFTRAVSVMISRPDDASDVIRMSDAGWLAVQVLLRDRRRDYPLVRDWWLKAGEALAWAVGTS